VAEPDREHLPRPNISLGLVIRSRGPTYRFLDYFFGPDVVRRITS
jgi:hypothetical protein